MSAPTAEQLERWARSDDSMLSAAAGEALRLRMPLDEFKAARDARAEVCRGDCEWPQGDGECAYCARERNARAAVLRLVEPTHFGRNEVST